MQQVPKAERTQDCGALFFSGASYASVFFFHGLLCSPQETRLSSTLIPSSKTRSKYTTLLYDSQVNSFRASSAMQEDRRSRTCKCRFSITIARLSIVLQPESQSHAGIHPRKEILLFFRWDVKTQLFMTFRRAAYVSHDEGAPNPERLLDKGY